MTGNKIVLDDLEFIADSDLNWSAFSEKTVLITGANGFLPSYMVETLLFLNYRGIIKEVKILALVRNLEKARLRFKDYLNCENLEFLVQDVCDPVKYDRKIDFIIHAASQASPKYYGRDPVGTLKANTIGTINMISLAEAKSVESFLYFSSSEVYGVVSQNSIPIKEMDFGYVDPTNIRSCYAESKRMGENICVSWFYQHKVPVKIVRPFHMYGPHMNLDDGRVYADFVSDIVNNRDLIMKSDGSAIRSFCYISDATIAFFKILLDGKNGEAYNVGNPQCEISIINLAQRLVELFPEKKLRVVRSNDQDFGYIKSSISRNSPDLSKISDLGWKPITDLKTGFFKTVMSYE